MINVLDILLQAIFIYKKSMLKKGLFKNEPYAAQYNIMIKHYYCLASLDLRQGH